MSQPARFRPADRVLLSRDYSRIRRQGRRSVSHNFVVSVAPREASREGSACRGGAGHSSGTRLGMSVSRKVGNAVMRNRIKRAIREWFRVSRERIPDCQEIVVIARRSAAGCGARQISRELNLIFAEQQERLKAGGPN